MQQNRDSNIWASVILVIVAIGLGAPVYEHTRTWLEDDLGGLWSFVVAVLASVVVVLPVVFLIHRIIERERNGKTTDLAAMIYRPAIFPIWVFAAAALKNMNDLKGVAPWAFLFAVAVFVATCVGIQKSRGKPWSWWLAVPVGVAISLVSLPIAMGITHLVSGS